jgi:hypothetical protein
MAVGLAPFWALRAAGQDCRLLNPETTLAHDNRSRQSPRTPKKPHRGREFPGIRGPWAGGNGLVHERPTGGWLHVTTGAQTKKKGKWTFR